MAHLHWLVASLLYGSGLRFMGALRLRVEDLDFGFRAIVVRDGKGRKDRVVTLADELIPHLRGPLIARRAEHTRDLARAVGSVYRPCALNS
ncbi:MAG: tyrosine-type recombinase/integrase [Gammaproteobacteria bacterium]|nr:tyrosine-type recombinase/integrase [Gammaproteobacteria bacterium]